MKHKVRDRPASSAIDAAVILHLFDPGSFRDHEEVDHSAHEVAQSEDSRCDNQVVEHSLISLPKLFDDQVLFDPATYHE